MDASYRWTTWLTGGVDERVIAIAPIVMDMLDFIANVHHMVHSHQPMQTMQTTQQCSPYSTKTVCVLLRAVLPIPPTTVQGVWRMDLGVWRLLRRQLYREPAVANAGAAGCYHRPSHVQGEPDHAQARCRCHWGRM